MAVIETWLEQDLQAPVKVRYLDGSLFSNNGNGNRIGVRVYNNGEPVTLSGTVSGYVVVADGSTVPCTGTRSGNQASILIPPAAYQPGAVFISVFLTDGSTVTTLAAVSTTVMQTRTNSQVSPGSVVTDWTQTINAAMQSVVDANAANMAQTYGELTFPVPMGKYTLYNNLLYRAATPIATSESWTAAHWTRVKLADDVSDLKLALSKTEVLVSITNFIDGYYIDTQASQADYLNPTPSANYEYVIADCEPGDVFIISGYGGNGPRLWCFVNSDWETLTPKATGNERVTNKKITAPDGAVKLIVNNRIDNCVLFYKSLRMERQLSELLTNSYQAKGVFPANADYNDYKSVGVYRKYANADYPVIHAPDWIPATETQILIVLRGNAIGEDTAIVQMVITYDYGVSRRQCTSGNWSQWERIDEVIKQKPVLCVSSFRKDAYNPGERQPYFLALSYDSGKSFFEIKDSQNFAGNNIDSTDIQLFEWNDGIIMICTSNNSVVPWDFKAVYTKDFVTYYDVKPDLGFMRKAAEYTNSPYVWSPQIFKKGNDFYIVASVSIGDTVNGDVYNPESTNSKTRYEYPFARKVTFSFDEINGFNIAANGGLFQLQFENETESIQDVSLLYSAATGKVFAAYKDRILNIINIASASDITGVFEDEETFVGDIAYSEACYLTTISKMGYLYWCTYGLRTSAKRRFFNYNANKVFDTSEMDDYVGVVNGNRFIDGVEIDMRNPYPIEISYSLFYRLASRYDLPTTIPVYNRSEKQAFKESAILTRMSHLIYNRLGKYVHIPDEYILPISAKTGGSTGDICDMCFDNPNYSAKIGSIAGTTTIRTPFGDPATIEKSEVNTKVYQIRYGTIFEGSKTVVD